jgi:hypothetical protein
MIWTEAPVGLEGMARAKKNQQSDSDYETNEAALAAESPSRLAGWKGRSGGARNGAEILPVSNESDHVDELPDDLDAGYVGVYQFPDNKRRRTPALLYVVVGSVMLLAWVLTRSDGSSWSIAASV